MSRLLVFALQARLMSRLLAARSLLHNPLRWLQPICLAQAGNQSYDAPIVSAAAAPLNLCPAGEGNASTAVLVNQAGALRTVAILQYRTGHLCPPSVPAIAMEELTLAKVHKAMLAGRLTCSQLLQGYLQVSLCWHASLGLSVPARLRCSKGRDTMHCFAGGRRKGYPYICMQLEKLTELRAAVLTSPKHDLKCCDLPAAHHSL